MPLLETKHVPSMLIKDGHTVFARGAPLEALALDLVFVIFRLTSTSMEAAQWIHNRD